MMQVQAAHEGKEMQSARLPFRPLVYVSDIVPHNVRVGVTYAVSVQISDAAISCEQKSQRKVREKLEKS